MFRNVELPFVWALLEPVLYTREDFAKQTQPIEIERIVSETSPFHVEPNRGTFPPLATVEFRLIFAPSKVRSIVDQRKKTQLFDCRSAIFIQFFI